MQHLLEDLSNQISSYYDDLVALIPKAVAAILVLIIFMILARIIRNSIGRYFGRKAEDPLLTNFLLSILRIAITIVGIMLALHIVGLGGIASGLLAGAGISAFVIGFAFKDIGENLLAGVMLAFARPFRIGDTIETGSIKGKMVSLSLRNTQIKTFDGKDVYVPNGQIIKNPLINYTIDGFMRYDFTIGLDYGSDVQRAIDICLRSLGEVEGILQQEGRKPSGQIGDLTASTLNITLFYWVDTFDTKFPAGPLRTRAVDRCLTSLTEAGYYLPGDIMEVKNYQESPFNTGATQSNPQKN